MNVDISDTLVQQEVNTCKCEPPRMSFIKCNMAQISESRLGNNCFNVAVFCNQLFVADTRNCAFLRIVT